MDRSPWLQRRLQGITGTDAAALLGLHPFRTAIEVWAEKVGLLRPRDIGDVERVKWGSILEAPIIREVVAATRRQRARAREWPEIVSADVEAHEHVWFEGGRPRSRTKYILASKRIPSAMVTPDFMFREWRPALVIGEQVALEGPGLGEIKTTSAYNSKRWHGSPPIEVEIQVQHGLLVADRPQWATAAVFIGGQALRIYDLPLHRPFLNVLEDRIGHFMDYHVARMIQPDAVGTEAERDALRRLYPEDDGTAKTLLSSWLDSALRIAVLKEQASRIDSELKVRETQLRAAIGRSSYVVIDGSGVCLSYKADARGVRTLRRLKDNAVVAPSLPLRCEPGTAIAGPSGNTAPQETR